MKVFCVTNFLIALCIGYLVHASWSIYFMWHPDSCLQKGRENFCIKSLIYERKGLTWNIDIYGSESNKFSSYSSSLIASWKRINLNESFTREYNIKLSSTTTGNGSYFIHVFLHPSEMSAFNGKYAVHATASATDYKNPVSYFKLMKDSSVEESFDLNRPTTHWRPKISFHVMTENFMFDQQKIPGELLHLIKLSNSREYLPMLFCDEFSNKKSDLILLQKNVTTKKLFIDYAPISIGKLRFWVTMSHTLEMMKSIGFTDDDLDDVKGIFLDTNLYFLGLTVIVSAFHMLFDFLGFKNDVHYWKKRKNMLGLSYHTVIYRCISTVIIFLYLFDQKTSLLVLVPAGIGSIIEIWKVTKAFKVVIKRSGWRLHISFGQSSEIEKETKSFDQQAIKYLSYVLYPLCACGAIYSLFYVPQKSWYSWIIQSCVNGVYAFGFLFMLPQLFINYKMKSVAHLPWKAFMYKAFNTFIDDIFAFIIRMPTSHRLACFRDDLVFFCYLYQLWLYPVDKKRVNEYGYSYDEEHEKKD